MVVMSKVVSPPSWYVCVCVTVAEARNDGFEPRAPGKMSFTSSVPSACPLLRHSSNPCVPSSAVK